MHDPNTVAPTGDADHRLPRNVLPRRYELRIEPDLAAATFAGREAVAVDVVEATHEIVLNAAFLDVDEAWVEAGGERIEATHSLTEERLTLTLAREVPAGGARVHLAFRGVLNDKLKGFYRSTFTDEDGVERVIGTTQMEPADARLAFPCWDEPDLKAVFAVTLVVAEDLLAVSNAAEASREAAGDGRVAVTFADTIPMSTYLVAFVVGPLEATEAVDVDGTPLRVVHVPGKGHLTPYALEIGAFCLRWFADYYAIAYPGDKCDLIALPDFAAGAMENLGAITFREALLLVEPDAVTQAELTRVADVVAHELAHMWFGDLVTMKWWNGLWLNEAFATFMELASVEDFRPDWQRWVAFTTERAAAFAVDALESTRPIEFPVASPEDAEGMFDVLTYQKGASVLRMLEQYLGTDRFRDGIRLYLSARAYGNAETTDLWDAIEEATGDPVRRIMDSWIFQGGYPLIGVSAAGDKVTLTQQRFRFSTAERTAPDDGPAGDGPVWSVPIVVQAGDGEPSKVLLEGPSTTVDLPGAGQHLVVNAGGHGFYRVSYTPELLTSLRARISGLDPIERALLVEDTWASVLAGSTSATALLDLTSGFSSETDPTVWAVLGAALGGIDRMLDGTARARFQTFVRTLVAPVLERLGWEPGADEDDLTRQTRGTVLSLLGVMGDDRGVQARAREVHDACLEDPSSTDPNVAGAVINIIAATGGDDDHAAFVERFRSSPSPQESLRYLYALSGFRQGELADRTLAMTLNGDIRTQNAPFVLLSLLGNRHVNEQAWAFVKSEWDEILERFPDSSIARFLGGIVHMNTPELAADVAAFLAEHAVPQGARTVEQHLERQRVNVALRAREAEAVTDRLPEEA
ncbi:MAG: M1 family metallopeptidase [Acidimicrobiales bacterium]